MPLLIQRSLLSVVCMTLALVLLSGCSKSPEQLVAAGKAYIGKEDYKAATIELRNALQKKPDLAEARYLLGVSLLETRDLLGAEKELRKAAELGYPEDKVLPQLAQVMLTLGQADKVIAEFAGKQLSEPAATADLLAAVGDAYLATGKRADAADAYAKALAAQPGHAIAKLGQAKLAALNRDLAQAEEIATQVATESPDRKEAWTLKAQLALAGQKGEDAVSDYRKALEAEPADLEVRLALGLLLLRQNQDDDAQREADAMAKIAPADPRTKFLQAQIALEQRKYTLARDLALSVLRTSPGHVPSLRTAGISHFFLRNDLQAQDQLRKVLEANRGDVLSRRLLVASYLRSGDVPTAKRTLKGGLELTPKDPGLLMLSGEIALAERDLEGATADYEAALSGADETSGAALNTRLAQLHFAAGESAEALQILESASAASDEQYQSDALLAAYYIRQGKPAEALTWVSKIEKKRPQEPAGPMLRGVANQASKDGAAARASFEKALQLQPTYAPALMALARMDLQAKDPASADKRFRAALEQAPGNEATVLAYVAFLQAQGAAPEKRAEVLVRFIQNQPTSVRGRVLLVQVLLEAGKAQRAATIAEEGLAAEPENPSFLRAAGQAQQILGNYSQAVAYYSKLVATQPQSPLPLVLLADAHLSAGDQERALDALGRARRIQADYLPAEIRAARLESRMGRTDTALKISRDIQAQRPKAPIGYLIEAEALANAKRWDDAERALTKGLENAPAPGLAVAQHRVLAQSGQEQRATAFAENWVAGHPKDVAFLDYLGDRAMQAGNYNEARKQYTAALQLAPNSPKILNNLAWVSGQLKDPKALDYAERAHALIPDSAAIMDTLGWLLVENGNLERGTQLLRNAVERAPAGDAIRLNLAKALLRSGNKAGARKELELLAKRGDAFGGQGEVKKLLQDL